ncbi:MAG TPA: hypothetical protein VJ750_00430 [Rhizomicrobium sp.]|nr:hypothetical protein [Rhizomicrobium sp.]
MDTFPKNECGFFHLTPEGWVRKDRQPFPQNRVETWAYEMECLAEDAKERVCLTRTWILPEIHSEAYKSLHARFGEPISSTTERNVTLECEV